MSKPTTAAVVALKQLSQAKTRLVELPPVLRQQWVLSMALDTIVALASQLPVVVVSDQPALQARLAQAACAGQQPVTVIADGQPHLNAALERGASWWREQGVSTVVASVADLPCLTPDDVSDLLAALTGDAGRWFVPDADGHGTTMLAARDQPLQPLFGTASAARHGSSGAHEVGLSLRARCDVDTLPDLAMATELGLGSCSRHLLTDAGTPASYAAVTVVDPDRAVTDSGVSVQLPSAEVLGVRRLAPGQRLHAALDADRVLSAWW